MLSLPTYPFDKIENWLSSWSGKTRKNKLSILQAFLKYCQAKMLLKDADRLTAGISIGRIKPTSEISVISPAMLTKLYKNN
jgi:hypothetical protein